MYIPFVKDIFTALCNAIEDVHASAKRDIRAHKIWVHASCEGALEKRKEIQMFCGHCATAPHTENDTGEESVCGRGERDVATKERVEGDGDLLSASPEPAFEI